MHFIPEPLFAVPTDRAYIVTYTITTGTSEGCIFMVANVGCIYKSAEEGFFGRKCRKINHSKSTLSFLVPSFINAASSEEDPLVQMVMDDSRHILYSRSEKRTIQLYDLGNNGQSMTRLEAVNTKSIVQFAANIARVLNVLDIF